ncbi:MAG: cell division protein FtsL [Gammaproteobacteria bacterium]|nr:cell division protein FtsL [Gammaproteobacteria bacterium]
MNSTARVINHSVSISRHPMIAYISDVLHSPCTLILMAVLVSALSLIYVSNTTRNLRAELHQANVMRDQLHVQWQQLLIEKGTWIMQARIQATAEHRLHMMMPERKSIVVLKENVR